MFAVLEHAEIQTRLHIKSVVKLQCTSYVVAQALYEVRPFLVALIRAPIDDLTPNLMAILLKLPLDVVCAVESCFAVWRTLGNVFHSLGTIPYILFDVKHGSGRGNDFGSGRCSKRDMQGAADLRD